ncbi:sensor histidine kinase [Streptomyces sodiiphilus]|uniref:histidine kinase n=1 Tax=Streptomyces sodiiphilus TaxID=226217 RepID=A0ABN2PVF9_9ACTN
MHSFLSRVLPRDRLLPVVAAVFAVDTGLLLANPPDEPAGRTVFGWILAGLTCVVFAFRRRWPVPVAVAALLAAAVYYPTGSHDGATPTIVFVLAIYTVAARGRLTAAVTLAAVTVLAMAGAEIFARSVRGEGNVDNMSLVLLTGWLLALVLLGHALRVRQDYLREAEQRARAAEGERDARARSAATEERLRIAREVHDVLGHSLSLINVQAAAAVHRSARRPGETGELVRTLESVRETSRDALRELRATLGVLRQADEDAPTEPVAGLERVGELAERARGAGLEVSVRVSGDPAGLPPQISLAGYRIVQEALTNTTRHAAASAVRIEFVRTAAGLRVTVEDDGRGAPGERPGSRADGGSGLSGMAERARALGGEFTAGNTASGFRVEARLPLPGDGR